MAFLHHGGIETVPDGDDPNESTRFHELITILPPTRSLLEPSEFEAGTPPNRRTRCSVLDFTWPPTTYIVQASSVGRYQGGRDS